MKAKSKKTTQEVVVFDLYLSMTEREAQVLYSLTQLIGGNKEGPRGVTDEIGRALRSLGITVRGGWRGAINIPGTWEDFEGGKEA